LARLLGATAALLRICLTFSHFKLAE
jgi:hypothetical protein